MFRCCTSFFYGDMLGLVSSCAFLRPGKADLDVAPLLSMVNGDMLEFVFFVFRVFEAWQDRFS